MWRRKVQWKHGTTQGSPRRKRTARASGISRKSVKSGCAREWGGWGRLSEDGPGQHNLVRSEGPWGKAEGRLHGSAHKHIVPDTEQGMHGDSREHGGHWQTSLLGRPCLRVRPWSRTGENPPYGILGEAMETSASFEARSAPLPYPTTGKD